MTVYILIRNDYEDHEILGVYRSEEDAQRAIPVGKGSRCRHLYTVTPVPVTPLSV